MFSRVEPQLGGLVRALGQRLEKGRLDHSLRVSETSRILAVRWGVDPERAALAGLVHDYARDLPTSQMLVLASQFGVPVDEVEVSHPVLLHGPVGACLVKKELGVTEEGVLAAIRLHTTGGPSMTPLEKVLYVADYIEPGRDLPHIDWARRASMHDLDVAVLVAMRGSMEYLLTIGRQLHRRSVEGWNWLVRERETKPGAIASKHFEGDIAREGFANGRE